MKHKPLILLLLVSGLLSLSFSPIRRYIRKAELNVERGNLEAARKYYEKALSLQPENIRANYGLGLMYCELLDNYDKALPHLERANMPPVADSLYDLLFALGKCYQHRGEFEKAIGHFDRLKQAVDLDGEKDLQKELGKRREDCLYAIAHRDDAPSGNMHVVNGGRTINSEMPEYVPVPLPGNRMLFTSKRKDDKKEKINYLDGKYYESMYICDVTATGFRNVQRYTIPDRYLGSGRHNRHESVVSLSPDGKTLFTFKKGSIYEISLSERSGGTPKKLESFVNKNIYQNHACMSRDGKHLYFTVEAESSLGGTDIFHSKKENGAWTTPENVGAPVNTPFDEDAPFLSDDGGTLYFASMGHKGYGNFDLYKSVQRDGSWSEPENLGKPLNSPGHDLFLVHDSSRAVSYFASGRPGGYGDLDIYKVLYLDRIDTTCQPEYTRLFPLEIKDADSSDLSNTVSVTVPQGYRTISAQWWLNNERQADQSPDFVRSYPAAGDYTLTSKVTVLCDTCLSPLVACGSIVNSFRAPAQPGTDSVITTPAAVELVEGLMDDAQLRQLGFNPAPVMFAFDKSTLGAAGRARLDSNIAVLKKYDGLRVRVVGYTDARGPAEYNQHLSERRAASVLRYLTDHGISSAQAGIAEGKGESELLNSCDGSRPCRETEHKKNRRVRLLVTNEKLKR